MKAQTTDVDFRRGDEVVARLSGVPVHNIEGGGRLGAACTPPWTIATVAGRASARRLPEYLLRFEHDGRVCLAWVSADLIEGLA